MKFRFGDFSLEDEPRSGRPTVIQDEDLRIQVETEPLQTVRGMAEELGVSSHAVFDSCYVGNSALIRMALNSIKLNKYSLRYYSLK